MNIFFFSKKKKKKKDAMDTSKWDQHSGSTFRQSMTRYVVTDSTTTKAGSEWIMEGKYLHSNINE